ncbi:MAG: homoserine O-acetyltransferase [Prevotellaceae bacterium]|jgi:homoserine O-acetyltransferase|nr:homoserine O-acetyltransferase [Prevotellaceae bacterium]
MTQYLYKYNQRFPLENGGELPELEICYHTSSENAAGKPVIWICHALTANSNPEEWWGTLVGAGKYFDTEKYFIICANILGSCYGSTGPQSPGLPGGKPYLLGFPLVSIRDMIAAHELLRAHLGIERIDLAIGGSSGGFQALEWAVACPSLIRNICLIACNARISPWGAAFNESQRMALKADATFEAQENISGGEKGLECARSIALLSYRSYAGYGLSQAEADDDCLLAQRACSYQRYQGKKLSARFNAYAYYYLTLSLDTHNVGRGRGGVEKALSGVKAKTLCIGIDSDVLFPISEMQYMAEHIPDAKLEIISSAYGHDGFLLEYEQISKQLDMLVSGFRFKVHNS